MWRYWPTRQVTLSLKFLSGEAVMCTEASHAHVSLKCVDHCTCNSLSHTLQFSAFPVSPFLISNYVAQCCCITARHLFLTRSQCRLPAAPTSSCCPRCAALLRCLLLILLQGSLSGSNPKKRPGYIWLAGAKARMARAIAAPNMERR